MELAEVYRVVYEKGPDDKLRGTIVCKDKTNGCHDLFNGKALDDDTTFEDNTFEGNKDDENTSEGYNDDMPLSLISKPNLRSMRRVPLIRSLDHIIPNGPSKASICAKNGFSVNINLFGVIFEEVTIEYPRHDMLSTPLTEDLLSEDGTRYLTLFYAIFENAVEAHVSVTLTNYSDPFYLYGVIAARTSAIDDRAYSSLIFLKGHGEKMKVGTGHDIPIPFSRHIVAVPLKSQLILEFSLNASNNVKEIEDGDKMVQRIVIFDAKRDGRNDYLIDFVEKTGEVKVKVEWKSVRKPREPEAQAN
ncbi:uncharacterized protein LOC141672000 [Apium graveolens]|uniref:uncharacterized protein LOC141672000 n=1 Tax=Apium graveolens TaxID=4045 RepID=UPI003D7BB03F